MKKSNSHQEREAAEKLIKQLSAPKERKPKSIRKILTNKFLFYLEDEDFCLFASRTLRGGGFILTCLVIYYPEQSLELINQALAYRDNFVIKAAIAGIVFIFLQPLTNLTVFISQRLFVLFLTLKHVRELRRGNMPLEPQSHHSDEILSVPVDELVEHLFQNKSFKRTESEKKFLLPRRKYTELAQKLEDVGVLQRGENNARVLNPLLTREQVSEMLAGKSDLNDLQNLWQSPASDSSFTLHKIT